MTNRYRKGITHSLGINFILLLIYCNYSFNTLASNEGEQIIGNGVKPSDNLSKQLFDQGYPPLNDEELNKILRDGIFRDSSNNTLIVDRNGFIKTKEKLEITTLPPIKDDLKVVLSKELILNMTKEDYIKILTATVDKFELLGAPLQTQYNLNSTIKNKKLEYNNEIFVYNDKTNKYEDENELKANTSKENNSKDENSILLPLIFGLITAGVILIVAIKYLSKFYKKYAIVNRTPESNH